MIKYRPHTSLLNDALKKSKEFETIDDMYNYVISKWNHEFSKDDLSISEPDIKDQRIDWKETRYICTKRIGKKQYDTPQCIGMCSIE